MTIQFNTYKNRQKMLNEMKTMFLSENNFFINPETNSIVLNVDSFNKFIILEKLKKLSSMDNSFYFSINNSSLI